MSLSTVRCNSLPCEDVIFSVNLAHEVISSPFISFILSPLCKLASLAGLLSTTWSIVVVGDPM